MSISRKNWSALSSLARQWTVEDEEEAEREKRRRVKTSSVDADDSQTTSDTPTAGTDSTSERSLGLSSVEQIQLDFVEMLRSRDEKRRIRHVETLRRQKEEGEDEAVAAEGEARVEILGELDEEQGSVSPSARATSKPEPPLEAASYSHSSSNANTNITNRQHENNESPSKDPDPTPSANPARKFVRDINCSGREQETENKRKNISNSVSISLDKSPSVSGHTTPMSPCSPTTPMSPPQWSSSYQIPSPQRAKSPIQNGHTEETKDENGSSSCANFEQTPKPAFVRQSSRTLSFRMMKKKEEGSSPLQRSASVRMASKKFESNTDQDKNEDEESSSPFLRNSKQRISSRSIKEKMEKLAQAAQKSEIIRSPDVTQRTLFMMEEVSRKRGIFEKEQQAAASTSPGIPKQEFRNFASGMSDRINRWLSKSNQTGSSHSPTDLRHVDINSKRSLFEKIGEDSVSNTRPGKINK